MPMADDVVLTAWQLLKDAPGRPAALAVDKILPHEDLPQEPAELPAVGIYLLDDQQNAESGSGTSQRSALIEIQIDVRIGEGENYLSATRAYRAWVLRALLPNDPMDSGISGAEHLSTKPGVIPGNARMAVALVQISVPFEHDPFEEA